MSSFRSRSLLHPSVLLAVVLLASACGNSGNSAAPAPSPADRIAALDAQVAQLDAEAARAEDVSEIKRLQRAYGYYLDAAQWDAMADLFADDGTIEIGLDGVYVGKERIREYLHTLGGGGVGLARGELNEHLILQPVIDVAPDGRTALGRWRALIIAGQYHKTARWGEGPYENDYVKQNGVWKIQTLHWYQTFMVPYAGGWAKNKDVNGGIYVSRKLPPDRPPTERYETWPGVYLPPYHYKNPVTATSLPPRTPDAGAAAASGGASADPAVVQLEATAAALQRRITLLNDQEQIENLISIYGYYLDKREWDELADLWADDGTMEISQRGIYIGKKSIRRALELFGPLHISTGYLHNHIQLQPVIHVSADGTRAWSRTRALSELGTYPTVGIWGDGVYENEYVKQDGIWKIAKDHIYTGFFATYDKGWQSGARPAPGPSAKIPPDRPPSELYDTYPGEYVPPFDYAHPVTGAPIEIPANLRVRPNPQGLPGNAESGLRTETNSQSSGDSANPAVNGNAQGTAAAAQVGGADGERLPDARARLAHVEQVVGRLEDERAIENLQRTYGYFVDKTMWKETADLFADDATLEIGGRGVFVGKARILQYLTWLAPKGLAHGLLMNHMQLQPIITVAPDGNTAKGRWRFLAEVGEYQKSSRWGEGTYENEYVKQGGVWKIKTLHAYFRTYTDYAAGWARSAVPNTRPEKDLPPDLPPTVKYDTYPATFIPPYHYPNPVTGK